jgi:hypothetical protein
MKFQTTSLASIPGLRFGYTIFVAVSKHAETITHKSVKQRYPEKSVLFFGVDVGLNEVDGDFYGW